jgi:hypothetical protein
VAAGVLVGPVHRLGHPWHPFGERRPGLVGKALVVFEDVQSTSGDVVGEVGELLRGHPHGFECGREQCAVRLADERAYPGDAEPRPGQRGGQAGGQRHID